MYVLFQRLTSKKHIFANLIPFKEGRQSKVQASSISSLHVTEVHCCEYWQMMKSGLGVSVYMVIYKHTEAIFFV